MYIKDFLAWFKIKSKIHQLEHSLVVRRGEIRWVCIGINVGSEIDGKGDDFARPCLILHVIGKSMALVIPLTSKSKTIPGYIPFEWKDKHDSICVHQMRVVSQKRILGRLGKISEGRLQDIKEHIKKFYSL